MALSQEVIKDLQTRLERDQKMRRGELEWDDSVDAQNTEFMKKLVDEFGWPQMTVDGVEVAQAAWLLVQHADREIEFQKRCLELMKQLPGGEVNLSHVAFLEDRVRVGQNQPQLYGTQFYSDDDFFGPRPIENIAELDDRRAAIGLEPFHEYETLMNQIYRKALTEE